MAPIFFSYTFECLLSSTYILYLDLFQIHTDIHVAFIAIKTILRELGITEIILHEEAEIMPLLHCKSKSLQSQNKIYQIRRTVGMYLFEFARETQIASVSISKYESSGKHLPLNIAKKINQRFPQYSVCFIGGYNTLPASTRSEQFLKARMYHIHDMQDAITHLHMPTKQIKKWCAGEIESPKIDEYIKILHLK